MPPQGIKLTPRHYAYLKISEGCNNRCTFCIIPSLRGDLVSPPGRPRCCARPRSWSQAGVKELLVISQDTSRLWRRHQVRAPSFVARTARCEARFSIWRSELGELGVWVRLHYVYPYPHVDEVIPLMAEGKVLPYLDIPFQHASPRVLEAMKRPAAQEKTLGAHPARGARSAPTSRMRSTFIVGFPGETEAEFEELLDWLDEAAARPRRLLHLRAGGGRGVERAARSRCRDEVQARSAAHALHGAAAGDLRARG
ncbi:MAG: radical SAM protein [Rhodopseudomonas palustris]|nr:radical SAM protein [Rhodopseudomonas palustris]